MCFNRIKKIFCKNQLKLLAVVASMFLILSIFNSARALLVNPAQGTSVTTSETIEYNTTVNANSVNNLNINNSAAGQTYNVNVLSGGNMSNSTIFRDIINITGSLSHNVFVTVNSGGAITHNSTTKEVLDDDASATGTVRLTINAGGFVTGRFNGSPTRTASEIINAGTINGDHQTLTLVNNSGTMGGGNINGVNNVTNSGNMSSSIFLNASGTVTNTNTISGSIFMGGNGSVTNSATISGSISMNTNDIINNNGSGSIGTISGTTGTQLRIGPSSSSSFSTGGNISSVATISLLNSSSLTINNGHTVSGFTSMTGSRPVTINSGGVLRIDAANALAITGAIANSGTIRVNNTFNPALSSSFTNPNGTIEINGSGSITNNISATGSSIFRIGTTGTSNFTTQGTISGFSTFNINNSSSLTGNHAISGVNTAFTIDSGCSATLNASFTGTATSVNSSNSGSLTINSSFGLAGFTNNNGATLSLSTGANNSTAITNNSGGILNVNGAATNTSSINNQGTVNITSALSGAGTLSNTSGGSISLNTGGATVANSITNNSGSNLSVTGNSVVSGIVSNSGIFTFTSGNYGGSGAVTNNSGGVLEFNGGAYTNTALLTNSGNATLNISTSLTAINNLSNSGIINVNNNGAFTKPTTFTNTGRTNLNGTGTINGAYSGGSGSELYVGPVDACDYTTTGAISGIETIVVNNGSLTANHGVTGVNTSFTVDSGANLKINNIFSGNGSFTNNGSTTFENTNANVSGFSSFINNNVLNITASSSSGVNITNAGSMSIAANLDMGVNSLSGAGNVTVSGQRVLTASAYTNTGTHYTAIRSASDYDKLTCTGCVVELSNLSVDTSSYAAPVNTNVVFTILTANSITAVLPRDIGTLFSRVAFSNTGTALNVTISRDSYANVAYPGINKEIAAIFDSIASGTQSAQQSALLAILNNSQTASEFNNNLQQLVPNANTIIPNVVVQNDALQKVELRVANLRDGYTFAHTGINAGELSPHRSIWMSNFGSITNQKETGNQEGYKAKSLGLLFGLDNTVRKKVVGVAFGVSGSHVKEFIDQSHTTDIDRIHGVFYGTNNMGNNNFLDWMLTGSLNNNRVVRPTVLNGVTYSNRAKFKSYIAAVKLIRGKSFNFLDSYRVSPITSLQYNYIRQHSYDESGSVSATHVVGQSKNILTLGAGARLNFPIDAWDAIGMRELRAIVTYDVLNNKDNTIVNFVVGGGSFTVVNTPPRLALRLGAGMTFEMTKHLQLLLNYDYEVRSRYTDHTGMLKVKYVF